MEVLSDPFSCRFVILYCMQMDQSFTSCILVNLTALHFMHVVLHFVPIDVERMETDLFLRLLAFEAGNLVYLVFPHVGDLQAGLVLVGHVFSLLETVDLQGILEEHFVGLDYASSYLLVFQDRPLLRLLPDFLHFAFYH